jgi:hypothetical protein
VNRLVQGFISLVVGAALAALVAVGLVASQSGSPEAVSTDVITYDD